MPDKKPTMREIARAVGTSAATVSKALAGKPGMSGRLRKKIEKKAAEMGYAYPGKRKETPSSRLNIGILIPESYFDPESYYSTLCKKLVQKLSERGHTGLLEILSREQEKAPELPGLVRSGHADGLILLGQPGREYCRMIVRCGIPVLFLDFYDGQGTADAVVGDNSYGAYRLTGHLIRNGHTRIGFVGNRLATSSIMDRYLGYYRAMLTYGLPVREEWILKDRTDEGEPAEIALPGTLPTAFVCNADTVARKLIAATGSGEASAGDKFREAGRRKRWKGPE